MNIRFYISNRIDTLSKKWIENTNYSKNIFQPHVILTQTQGMNNWLKLQRVQALGNSTNLQFVTPNDFLLFIYELIQLNSVQKISNRNIDLIIYKILSEKEFQYQFPDVTKYFTSENTILKEIRQWELAYQTSDLLDQYQIYRQDTLRRWLEDDAVDAKFRWQQYIWKRLHDVVGERLIDLSEMQTNVFHLLEDKSIQQLIFEKYPHISIFGISILSAYHIQMLYKLSEIIQIDFYLLNPAPEIFWDMDISESERLKKGLQGNYVIGNELLTNWGKVIQQTFRLLNKDDLLLNTSEILDVEEWNNDTLLGNIKNSILNNHVEKLHWSNELIFDQSIFIANHYTIQNEVIGLYNFLLHQIQNGKEIKDSDVLIICTDIDLYTPYIRSVFENSPYPIRYTISDESIQNGDSIISALSDILNFDFNRFTVENVFELLEHKSIRLNFSITRIHFLKNCINRLNIRYGIYNHEEDDTYLVSWWHGMKKSVLDIFIEGQEEYVLSGKEFVLKDLIDQNEDILELSRLFEFVDRLMDLSKEVTQSKTLVDWKVIIDEVIVNFFNENSENFIEQYEFIFTQLKQLETISEFINHEKLSFKLFAFRLSKLLHKMNTEGRFLKRGITFCSPIPFRSVPFKMIGFLGMNFDAFPRRHVESTINYITHHPQLGDRNTKENDRHLFLESILSAEKIFYVSYLGRNTQDNTIKPPSILVEELIEYIQFNATTSDSIRHNLIQYFPLNAYSYKFNKPKSILLPNYLIKKSTEFISIFKKEKVHQDVVEKVNWRDVIQFFINPSKYYLNKYRSIYLSTKDEKNEGYETLLLNHLDEYIFREKFDLTNEKSFEEQYKFFYKDGQLPLKNVSEYYINKWKNDWSEIDDSIKTIIKSTSKITHSIECEVNSIIVSANITTYGKYLIEIDFSNNSLKKLLHLYINYLLLRSQNIECTPLYFSKTDVMSFDEIKMETVQEKLKNVLGFYVENYKKALPIDSKINFKKLTELSLEPEKFIAYIKSSYNNEYADVHIKYIIEHYSIKEVMPEIVYIATEIYESINNCFYSVKK